MSRLGLQCQTPLRFYPLSLDPWPLSLDPYCLSLPLVPYPLVVFLSRNLGEGCSCYLKRKSSPHLVLGLKLKFNKIWPLRSLNYVDHLTSTDYNDTASASIYIECKYFNTQWNLVSENRHFSCFFWNNLYCYRLLFWRESHW